MTAYYNEIDHYAAQWLRNLIDAGHIAPGIVDERSIEDVYPSDLEGFAQCHFFAGIGVWSLALRNAGWHDDRPVWTGSCPCQPFSAAGKGDGFDDPRHLWPSFAWLIAERRPPVVFGEQVASKDAEPWIDAVQADMEALAYAFGSVPFPAAGVGAPHIRERTYWVADAGRKGLQKRERNRGIQREALGAPEGETAVRGLLDGRLGVADGARRESGGAAAETTRYRRPSFPAGDARSGATVGFWREADWIWCADGKWRPVEPGSFPLVDGASARVGRLRAYGNAIVEPQARAFIESYLEASP